MSDVETRGGRAPTARERGLAAAALLAVSAHVVVDAALLPEPGTSADDHLVSGGVPLALLLAAAAAYPRLRAGAGAILAAAVGALALVGAGLAAVHAAGPGPSGDDWTALLLLAPAGLLLAALAARTLWRSRKPGGRRLLRRALLALAALAGAYVVLLPLAVALAATHRPREAVEPVDLGRPHEEVAVRTDDGLELRGRYVPSRNGAAVLVYPGSASRAPQARLLVRRGYGVLLLDPRGYAESDGDANAFGWEGRRDADAAVAFLRERPDVRDGRVAGLGFSVGGEVLLDAAARNPGLRAVVSEGAGQRSVREALLRGPAGWAALPSYAVQTAAVAVLAGAAPPPSLADLVPRIAPRPILLIEAGRGAGGEELNAEYLEAARPPKARWRIPEAGHTGGYEARPAEYERRVVSFLDAALDPDRG